MEQEKVVLQWVLITIMGYEIVALHHKRVPTLTHMMKKFPWYGSSAILGALVFAAVDHIYYQKYLP